MKTISCREAGFDCEYTVRGETEWRTPKMLIIWKKKI